MVCFFEFSVFDKYFAVLAPVFWLLKQVSDMAKVTVVRREDERWTSSILTFGCSELKACTGTLVISMYKSLETATKI